MSTMKLSIKQKILIIVSIFFINQNQAHAWGGYDYDAKTTIDIGPGNLVREGLIIQFYDTKADAYHSAKVILLQETSSGSNLQVEDLETKKIRNFIME